MFKSGSEAAEQAAVVKWLEMSGYKFTSVPSDTYTKSIRQKIKNKMLGVRPGMSDLIIILKRGSLLFLEMKKAPGKRGGKNGSKVSDAQLEWQKQINECVGAKYEIARGFIEAIKIIEKLEKA